jgi:hypothetical protein
MSSISTPRRRLSFGRRAAGILAVLGLIATFGGTTTASADVSVAGARFETDAKCTTRPYGSAGSLSTEVRTNALEASYMTFISEWQGTKWGPWQSGNVWHRTDAYTYSASEDFYFNRYSKPHYWAVMMHYRVPTSAGWQYGGEVLAHFIQAKVPSYGFPTEAWSSYCQI